VLNYYEFLEVSSDATIDEIKRAFRKRAKRIHPDLGNHADGAQERMRDLLKAYEVLMDPFQREAYDVQHKAIYGTSKFDYRQFLRERTHDDQSQSKLIFFDLLHNHEQDALRLYEKLLRQKKFDLSRHLDREDFMDCAFLLAEEFEHEDNFDSAFYLLKTIAEYELEKPYFRHFFEEVTQRLRNLVSNKMVMEMSSEKYINYLEQLINLRLSQKETAFYLKKMSEVYLSIKDYSRAQYFLQEGLKLNRSLAGVKKLKQTLGM
jgi:curved DNA-binding protein CbpA